jgi:hypothetical protein
MIEIMGEIKDNWKFNGKLTINLYKSKTKDQNEKGAKIWGWHWSLVGAKLHKIRSLWSIRSVRKKLKARGPNWNLAKSLN